MMKILEISGQFYITIIDENTNQVMILDGPYQQKWHAESMSRIRDIS